MPRRVPRPLLPDDLPAMQDHRSPRLVAPEARDWPPGHRQGLKKVNHDEWLRKKLGVGTKKRRGWLMLHLCVNADTGEVLAHDLTSDKVGDHATFIPLVNECLSKGLKVARALGDGIFDFKEISTTCPRKRSLHASARARMPDACPAGVP